jgi:biopolymer transport protein ExbD
MSWSIRHQGSPKSVDDLTVAQIVDGLQDGLWEPTDEVMGPNDADWVAIESHPQFAEIAEDLEPPLPTQHEDETRLDMNALIDVCLVLLIFFILTVSFAALQKTLDAPKLTSDQPVPVISQEVVKDKMIVVSISMEGDQPVYKVEDHVVDRDALVGVLRQQVKAAHKFDLLINYGKGVRAEAVYAVQDAAAGARIPKVHIVVPKDKLDALKK